MIHLVKGVTEDAVTKVKLKTPPAAGKNWKGVSHKDVLAAFRAVLAFKEIKTHQTDFGPRFALSANKLVMAAAFDVTWKGMPKFPKGFVPMVGVQAGNDRHTPLTVYSGFRTGSWSADEKAVQYAAVTGAVVAPGLNTIHAQTAGRLEAAMDELFPQMEIIPDRISWLGVQENPFTDFAADVIEAARLKLIPWSYIRTGVLGWNKVYAKPPYRYSVLTSLACFWKCLGGTNPVSHLRAGHKFSDLAQLGH